MFFRTSDVDIHYDDRGTGEPTLIFLHYWGGSGRTWRHVVDRLADEFRTVAVDQRGWGRSGAPPSGYALSDMAGDVEGLIAHLALDRYVLVGHSMGGKVAQLVASRRPAGLVGLMLVASAPPTPLALDGPARDMMASAYDDRGSVSATIDQVLAGSALSAADREQVIEDSLTAAPAAKRSWPTGSSQEDITAATRAIAVPAEVVSGEADRVDTIAKVRAELLPHLGDPPFHVLPGVGHLLPLEAPDAVATLIRAFARRVG